MSYRVAYGETMPSWERTFPTRQKAAAFAKEHEGMGDLIFSVAKVIPGEPPQSLSAAIDADKVDDFIAARSTA